VDRLGVPSPCSLPQERGKKEERLSPRRGEKKKNASPQEREEHIAYIQGKHISHISKGSTYRVYPKRWRLMTNKQAKEKKEVPLLGERAG